MKFSANNPAVWLVRSQFKVDVDHWIDVEDKLPKNLCSLFWKSLIALLGQILCWPFLLVLPFSKEARRNPGKFQTDNASSGWLSFLNYAGTGFAWNFLSALFVKAFFIEELGFVVTLYNWPLFYLAGLLGVLASAGVVVLIVLILFGFAKIGDKLSEAFRAREDEEPSVVTSWAKSFKDKTCPLVTYDLDKAKKDKEG